MTEHQVKSVMEWMETKQVALWGSGWMITAEDRREQAAEWFAQQMNEYMKWYGSRNSRTIKKSPKPKTELPKAEEPKQYTKKRADRW